MTCLMLPFGDLRSHADVGAAATRAPSAPFGRTCAAAIPAATRHAMTRAPRAPALRQRLMLLPLWMTRATLYPFGYRGEGVWRRGGYSLANPMRSYIAASVGADDARAFSAPSSSIRCS